MQTCTDQVSSSGDDGDALHERIRRDLRSQIADGRLAVGAALPSESELCRRYGVSRGPVRQAVASLRAEGLISVSRGRSPRVIGEVPAQPLTSFLSFSAWAHSTGRRPGQRTVEIARRAPSAAAASALRLEPDELAVSLLRLRLLDDEPVMIERTTFVPDVGDLLFTADTDAGSVFAHLTDRGVDLFSARHTFDAVAADATDASLLGIPETTPLLRESRVTHTSDGRPVEVSDDRYLSDQVTFTIENTLDTRTAVLRAVPDT